MKMKERRGFIRVDDIIPLKYSSLSDIEERDSIITNIGGGGIKVETNETLQIDEKLELTFNIPNKKAIHCSGQITWKSFDQKKNKNVYGIQFINIIDKDRKEIIEYIYTNRYKIQKSNEIAIEVNNLCKFYNNLKAVNNINLSIRQGEIFALLGPNGAGKTTTTRILSTLLKPTSGSVEIFGLDLEKERYAIRKIIGYMPQEILLYNELSARENLKFFGQAQGLKGEELDDKIDEALSFVELQGRANSLVRTFSGGMKQRLSLACALVHQPKILFLDEPTSGVDLRLRKNFWDYFHKLAEKNVTIFVTTHQMDEVECCFRTAFMQAGKIVIDDTPDNIKKLGKSEIIIHYNGNTKSYKVHNVETELPLLLQNFQQISDIKRIEINKSSLEEILRELIKGEEMRD